MKATLVNRPVGAVGARARTLFNASAMGLALVQIDENLTFGA